MNNRPSYEPTDEQAEAIRLSRGGGNVVIQARAGAGKSSTLKLIAWDGHDRQASRRVKYLVFNADMAKQAKAEFPDFVDASTAHSTALKAIRNDPRIPLAGAVFNKMKADRMRPSEIAGRLGLRDIELQPSPGEKHGKLIPESRLASSVMQAVKKFCSTTATQIEPRHFSVIEGIDEPGEYLVNNEVTALLLPYAQKLWEDLCSPDGRIAAPSAIHDVYFKLWAMNSPYIPTDVLLYDEVQDTDPVAMAVVEAQRHAQIVAVGDSEQSIYGWRGAVDALPQFADMGADCTYLTHSFRFGPAVAEVGNRALAKLNVEPDTYVVGSPLIRSSVGPVNLRSGTPENKIGFIARSNAGAVNQALELIGEGVKVSLGKGSAAEIVRFARAAEMLQTGRRTMHNDLACFRDWDEVQRYASTADGSDLAVRVKLINDHGAKHLEALLSVASQDRYAAVLCMTAHRSKGLEFDRVKLASDFPNEDPGNPEPTDGTPPRPKRPISAEEWRLLYVAATRAKHVLDIEGCAALTEKDTGSEDG